jgi:Tol biopolymer transport system component
MPSTTPIAKATSAAPTRAPQPASVKVTLLQENGGRVSWSHAKNLIAFDAKGRDGYADVYTIRPDGSDKRCLTCDKQEVPQLHDGNPEWHPSGEYIVFQAQDPELKLPAGLLTNYLASPGIGINNNVWVTNADGFSGVPQGKYYYDFEIYTLDLATKQLTRLTENDEWDEHAHYSPNGKTIVWASSTGIAQKKADSTEELIQNPPKLDYWIMNVDGSNKRRLTQFNDPNSPEALVMRGITGDFSWGLDGTTIAAKVQHERTESVVLIELNP